MQTKEFADFVGVSVRTLHYYDEIGLLKPAEVDEQNGYRFYDEKSVLRMQEILFYRELDFSLKNICKILSFPDCDRKAVLLEQKKLLTLKKERLERIIESIEAAAKGENIMKAFDNSEFEKYKNEAKRKWGETEAHAEYEEKSRGYSKDKFNTLGDGMGKILEEFAVCMKNGANPGSKEAKVLVKKLQDYITANFYTCTDEILAGLGQMYVADERFRNNINRYAEGNAEFISKAIADYCG